MATDKRERQRAMRDERRSTEYDTVRRTTTRRRARNIVLAVAAVLVFFFVYSLIVDDGDDQQTATSDTSVTSAPEETTTTFSNPAVAEEVLGRTPPDPEPPPAGTAATALESTALIEGEGAGAANGDTLTVHYVGKIADGTVFDESWTEQRPFTLVLGTGGVISGWEEGLVGAKLGERRRLVIGSEKAYGAQGSGPIPPDAPLAFEIDIIDIVRA